VRSPKAGQADALITEEEADGQVADERVEAGRVAQPA
jgi:hypothetical protein